MIWQTSSIRDVTGIERAALRSVQLLPVEGLYKLILLYRLFSNKFEEAESVDVVQINSVRI